jgi:hypothetical protein
MQIIRILSNLKNEIEKLSEKTKDELNNCQDRLGKILETLNEIEESWSGSWIGYHAGLYYRDFRRPPLSEKFDVEWGSLHGVPAGWEERTYEDIALFVSRKHKGVDLEKISDCASRKLEETKDLHSKMCAELSFIRGFENLDKEVEILEQIEAHEWGISTSDFIKSLAPKTVMTRDTRASAQGMIAPPHIRYKSEVVHLLSIIDSVKRFIKSAMRLLRQIEVRVSIKKDWQETVDPMQKVTLICEKFHEVVRTLKQRHKDREALEINDEYDVQDLLHALLRLFFDDIRPEEWTPSYAGSRSKMDFLLKGERIVVEVKFDLTDREIGDQLLVDIARYRNHPDCKALICFAYDPRGKVKNPKGLERDLGQQSNEQLSVKVVIR